jgi:hypothetical protein
MLPNVLYVLQNILNFWQKFSIHTSQMNKISQRRQEFKQIILRNLKPIYTSMPIFIIYRDTKENIPFITILEM